MLQAAIFAGTYNEFNVAVKKYKIFATKEEEMLEKLAQQVAEVERMRTLANHPNVIRIFGQCRAVYACVPYIC